VLKNYYKYTTLLLVCQLFLEQVGKLAMPLWVA